TTLPLLPGPAVWRDADRHLVGFSICIFRTQNAFKNLSQVTWPRSHMKSRTEQGMESRLRVRVITVVFITLLAVLVVIIIYLYKNKGSYHTYEQPEADVSVQMENLPSKGEKEEYFI
uniref:Uncharacterized protein n=1 Tax=Gopherus evgoodei TaxID=1825980 RepID=A0A8C4YE45_9SAUR